MEILNTQQVVVDKVSGWDPIALIPLIAFGLLGIVITVATIMDGDNDWYILWLAALSIAIGGLMALIICKDSKSVYATQYQAIFPDNQIPNDFYDKYEIVGQEGKIVIIQDINTPNKEED